MAGLGAALTAAAAAACVPGLGVPRSLGGALACLAAADAARTFSACGCGAGAQLIPYACSVCCYSFGAPHIGNTAFRCDYLRCCPDTWQIINGALLPCSGTCCWGFPSCRRRSCCRGAAAPAAAVVAACCRCRRRRCRAAAVREWMLVRSPQTHEATALLTALPASLLDV